MFRTPCAPIGEPTVPDSPSDAPVRRAVDARRDGLGAVLALLALVLPWNLHTGLGIGGRGGCSPC